MRKNVKKVNKSFIEIDTKVNKKLNGYNGKDYTYEKCTKPIFIDPSEFSNKVKMEID